MKYSLAALFKYLQLTDTNRFNKLFKLKNKDIKKFYQVCETVCNEMDNPENELEKYGIKNFLVDPKEELNNLNVDLENHGIRYIDNHYNYDETRCLTNQLYKEKGKLIFFVSNGTILKGKLVNEIRPFRQEVTLCFSGECRTERDIFEKVFYIDDKPDKRKRKRT